MNLPQSLASWAPHLAIFPEEVSLAVGTMAGRLAPFVGSMTTSAKTASGEPDGYDGIARRGSYTRLLLSELALADELPEEFLRRAAMNEHLFLQLARVEPGSESVSIALFDAGAEQIGTPRAAHIAALVVLARRAQAAKAKFLWSILQNPENEFFTDVTPETIAHLLNARTAAAADDEMIKKWRDKFADLSDVNDVWLVGSNRLMRLSEARKFSVLSVEDVLDPQARQIDLRLRSASGTQKTVVLDLPDNAMCTRLLRDPFASAQPKTQKTNFAFAETGNVVFNEQGNKLLVRLGKTGIGLLNVPNSPRDSAGRPKKYQNFLNTLVAVGNWNQSIALFTFSNQSLHLYYAKQGQSKLAAGDYLIGENSPVTFILPEDESVLLLTFNLWLQRSNEFEAAILDANQTLFKLASLPAEKRTGSTIGTMEIIATKVLGAVRLAHNFVFVGNEPETDFPRIVSIGAQVERKNTPLTYEPHKALFGYGAQAAHQSFGLLALETLEKREWTIVTADGDRNLRQNYQTDVVGVFQHPGFDPEVGLLELDADKRTIFFNCESRRKQVFQASDEIVSITQSQRSPLLAYKTVRNEIVVYSFTHRADVCRYTSNV